MTLWNNKNYIYIIGTLYVLLPLLFFKAKILFVFSIIVLVLLILFWIKESFSRIFFLYLFSASLFGLSIGGIKLFDIIAIIAFVYLCISHNMRTIIATNINWFYFFIIYVFFSFLILLFKNQASEAALFQELFRFVIAIVTLLTFSQKCFSSISSKNMVRILDYVGFVLLLQIIVMSICQSHFGSPSNLNFGPLSVNVFDYNNSPISSMNEERVSAFFSDPNKLMCFFFLLLLLKKTIGVKQFELSDMIFLIGALLTEARTAFGVVLLYLIINVFIRQIFKSCEPLGVLLLAIISIVIGLYIYIKDISVEALINNFFKRVLSFTGRSQTLKTDSNVQSDSRVLIWKMARQYIYRKPFLGNGILSESILLPYPTHNTVVQLILDYGFVGFTIYAVAVMKIVLKHMNIINWILLLLIPSLVLDLANYNCIFFVFAVILCKNRKDQGINNGINGIN